MKKSKICNIICIVFMGIILVLQFMPFWNYGGMTTSIQNYIWNPLSHTELGEFIAGHVGADYIIDQIIMMPIIVLFSAVAGIIVCIWKSDNLFTAFLPLLCGGAGIWGYLCKPAFRLGANWGIHLAICIIIFAAAILKIVFKLRND